jgi:hypothetical protein
MGMDTLLLLVVEAIADTLLPEDREAATLVEVLVDLGTDEDPPVLFASVDCWWDDPLPLLIEKGVI